MRLLVGVTGEDDNIKIVTLKEYLNDNVGGKSADGGLFQIEVSSRTSVLDELFEMDEEESVKMTTICQINNVLVFLY